MKVFILVRAISDDNEYSVTRTIDEKDFNEAQYPEGTIRTKIKEVRGILSERLQRPDVFWKNEPEQ